MMEDNTCKKCKREMKLLRELVVKGTTYRMLKCEKCKFEIARAER